MPVKLKKQWMLDDEPRSKKDVKHSRKKRRDNKRTVRGYEQMVKDLSGGLA